jgi:hypothetical protein
MNFKKFNLEIKDGLTSGSTALKEATDTYRFYPCRLPSMGDQEPSPLKPEVGSIGLRQMPQSPAWGCRRPSSPG